MIKKKTQRKRNSKNKTRVLLYISYIFVFSFYLYRSFVNIARFHPNKQIPKINLKKKNNQPTPKFSIQIKYISIVNQNQKQISPTTNKNCTYILP